MIELDVCVFLVVFVFVGLVLLKKLFNLIIGMMLGGCCGFGFVIVFEVFNNKISNVEDIECKFGVLSIGVILLI